MSSSASISKSELFSIICVAEPPANLIPLPASTSKSPLPLMSPVTCNGFVGIVLPSPICIPFVASS